MRYSLRRGPPWRCSLGLLTALVGSLAAPSTASAGSFDASGRYQPDPAAVAVDDFETIPTTGQGGAGGAGAGGTGGDAGQGGEAGGEAAGSDSGGGDEPPYTLAEDATALTGTKVLKLKTYDQIGVGFEAPAANGSYVARVWVKGEVVTLVEVSYGDGTPGLMTQLFPTGRSTSDGWFELESAEFSIDVAHQPDAALAFFAPYGATVDAFEVVPRGEFRTAGRVCDGINSDQCMPDEICQSRRCMDARGYVPSMPDEQSGREALAAYMGNRLQFLFGPLRNRAEYMGDAMAAIAQMKQETDRYRYWFAFTTALQRLQDSHSVINGLFQFSPPPGGDNRVRLNVCFVNGDADLSHGQVPRDSAMPDVLVSHTGGNNTWGLAPGDRLVAIDGQHPVSWARGLNGRSWSAQQINDPASPAMHLEQLRGTIPSLAHDVTVIRCPGGVCGAPETLLVAAQANEGNGGPGGGEFLNCDHRPLAHLPDQPSNHYLGEDVFHGVINESDATERIHGMAWDSLVGAGSETGAAISQAVSEWTDQKARGVILDHRTGNGGTKDAALPILAFVSPTKYSEAQVWRTFLDEKAPPTLAAGLTLFDTAKLDPNSLAEVGSDTPRLDVPVALLITRDVSASDYFPNAFKGSPNARIFGPHPTNGAFSTFLQFSYWLGLSYQLASEDTINHDGRMLCGHGVTPDVIVEPLQSDLVKGVDTVYATALAWVRASIKPETP